MQRGINFSDSIRAIRRHKVRVALVFGLLMSLLVVWLIVCPRVYQSEAQLFVRLGRQSVALDPTATTGQTVALFESRELELNSIVKVLSSHELAQTVVDRVTHERIRSNVKYPSGKEDESSPSIFEPAKDRLKYVMNLYEPVSDREKAIREFSKSLGIVGGKKSGVISIFYKANNPILAQDVVAALVDEYQKKHVNMYRTKGSYHFFDTQSEKLLLELREREGALRDLKIKLDLASVAGKRERLQKEMLDIELRLLDSQEKLEGTIAKMNAVTEKLTSIPDRIQTEGEEGLTNVGRDLYQQLFELENQEADLSSRYSPGHPDVLQIRKTLENSRAMLQKHLAQQQSTSDTNPIWQTFETARLEAYANMTGLQASVKELKRQQRSVLDQIATLNSDEIEVAQLSREVEIAEKTYKSYKEKLEQARVDEALVTQSISNVNVVQDASFVAKPIVPSTPISLALGTLAAIFGALGSALFSEFRNRPLSTVEQIEASLDLPVLVTLPKKHGFSRPVLN